MTKLQLVASGREIGVQEAVDLATEPFNREGVIERLQEKAALQDRLIANLLMVIADDYGDNFTSGHEPKTRADKLAFILGSGRPIIRVNEV